MAANPQQQALTGGIAIAGIPIEKFNRNANGAIVLDDLALQAIAQEQATQRNQNISEVESGFRSLFNELTANVAQQEVNPNALGSNFLGAAAGGLGRTLGGAATGAAIGGTLLPGIGAVPGGLIGGALGAGLAGFNRSNFEASQMGQYPDLGASAIRGLGEGALQYFMPQSSTVGQALRNTAVAGAAGGGISAASQLAQGGGREGSISVNRLLSDIAQEAGGQIGGDLIGNALKNFRLAADTAPISIRQAVQPIELPRQAVPAQMVDGVARLGAVENVDAAQPVDITMAQQMANEFNEFMNGLNQLVSSGNTRRAMRMAREYADGMMEQAQFDPDPQAAEVAANAAKRAIDYADMLQNKPYTDKAAKLEADYGVIQSQMQKGKVSIKALKAFRNKVQNFINDSAAPENTRQYAEMLRDAVDDEILSLEETAKAQAALAAAKAKREKERAAAIAKVNAAKVKQATGDLTQGNKVRDELVALREDIIARSKQAEAALKEKADATEKVNAAKIKQAVKENLPTENKVRPELVQLRKDIEARSKAEAEAVKKNTQASIKAGKELDAEAQATRKAQEADAAKVKQKEDAQKARIEKLGQVLRDDMERLKNIEGDDGERIASGVAKASEITPVRNRAAKIETDPNAPANAKKAAAIIRKKADVLTKQIKDRDAAARKAKIKPKAKADTAKEPKAVKEFVEAVEVFDKKYDGMDETPAEIRQKLDTALQNGGMVEVDYYAEVTGGNVAKPVLKRKLTIVDSGFDSKGRPWYRTIDQENGDIQTRKLFDGPDKSRFSRASSADGAPRYMPVEGDANSVVDTQTGEILSRTGDDIFELTNKQVKDAVSLVDDLRRGGVDTAKLKQVLEELPEERRKALFKEIMGVDC